MAKKILCGFVVVMLGILALLGNINVIRFDLDWNIIWPVILLLLVVGNILDNKKIDIGSIIFLLIGFYFLLRNVGIISISFFKIIVPVILILIGLGIMLPKSGHKYCDEVAEDDDDDKEVFTKSVKTKRNDIMANALFSGTEVKSESKELNKIESTAIFGGTTIDLRHAKAKDGKCVLDASAVFGGVNVLVSDDWKVKTDGVTCIFGGVENKHLNSDSKDAKNTLYIQGLAVFGGIEIK